MNKTLWVLTLIAGLIVLFVLTRFLDFSSNATRYSPAINKEESDDKAFFSQWIHFSPDNQEFTVSFPREPQHVSETTNHTYSGRLRHFEIYASEGIDGNVYVVQEITFPEGADLQDDLLFLETTLSDIVSASNVNSLESKKEVTFQDRRALSFQIDSKEKNIMGVMFLVQNRLFILTRISRENLKQEIADFNYFTNSFKVQDEALPKSLKKSNR